MIVSSWWARGYDWIQKISGSASIQKILKEEIGNLPQHGRMLDLGGGTGMYRGLCPRSWLYLCLDCDPIKLRGFQRTHPRDPAVQGTAIQLPFAEASFDLCLMFFVAHHMSPKILSAALQETARILCPKGRFFLADAVWNKTHLPGRVLWSLDRGCFPKPAETLKRLIGDSWVITRQRRFRVYHEYAVWECRPRR